MLLQELGSVLPKEWSPMDLTQQQKIIKIPPYSQEFQDVEFRILGNYYTRINGIYRIQNPYLYTKFTLKMYEYGQRGPYDIISLFHDTPSENVMGIVSYNFDWRYGERFKYGPGVYFSVSPNLANKHSFKVNHPNRSMFIVDVIVQNIQTVDGDIFLPDYGYDTVLAHNSSTYVKYFDCEYYPRYFVDYINLR